MARDEEVVSCHRISLRLGSRQPYLLEGRVYGIHAFLEYFWRLEYDVFHGIRGIRVEYVRNTGRWEVIWNTPPFQNSS